MLYSIVRPIVTLLVKLLFRLEVSGRQYLPARGGFILASNHLSYLDPVVLGVASPRKLNFMAKRDLFTNRLFSAFIGALGAIPLKRNHADLSALRGGLQLLKEGTALVLFPQGTRREPSKAYPGVGFLAVNAGVPIIPARIQGTETAMPKGRRFIRPAKVKICFGEPIFVERRCKPDYIEIAQKVMSRIRNLKCE
jgi:1-acyl-sn-glycerol-3-phosphate acyltransferase